MITQCECGSKNFFVLESISYRAFINEDNALEEVKNLDSGIESITCNDCGKEYQESDFNEIIFN